MNVLSPIILSISNTIAPATQVKNIEIFSVNIPNIWAVGPPSPNNIIIDAPNEINPINKQNIIRPSGLPGMGSFELVIDWSLLPNLLVMTMFLALKWKTQFG